jgi:hypothetical protein
MAGKIIYVLLLLFASTVIGRAQCVPASTAAGALDTCFGNVTVERCLVSDEIDGRLHGSAVRSFNRYPDSARFCSLIGRIAPAGTCEICN